MNVWVTAESAWMDMIKWEKCEYIAPRHELKTYPMWVGVDLAHKIDICAAAKLWRTDNGHVHADFKFWLRKDGWNDARGSRQNFTGSGRRWIS